MRCPDRTSPIPALKTPSFVSVPPMLVALLVMVIVTIGFAPPAQAVDRKPGLCDAKADGKVKKSPGCTPPLSPQFLAAQSQVPTPSGVFYPYRVAVDVYGNVYISDTNNNRVLKETYSQGAYSETVVASGLSFGYGVAADSSQNVYIVENGNNRVLKETFAEGTYTQAVLPTSTLYYPTGIAVDASGNVYLCDTGNGRILKESPSGNTYAETVVDTGYQQIVGIAVDSGGDVFVSDIDSMNVYEETYSAGSYTGSTVPTSGLSYPYDVTVDSNGNLYIADFNNTRIVELANLDGSYTQSVYPTVNLAGPLGLTVDVHGDLYIADTFGFNIKEEAVNGGNFGPTAPEDSAAPIFAIFQFAGGSGSDMLTLGAINIDTNGGQGLDYVDADASTCSTSTSYQAGDWCAVSVAFHPMAPGLRNGAVQLLDGSLNVLATSWLTGTGLIPLMGFTPPPAIPVASGVNLPFGLAFDGYGNLFEADYGTGNVKEFFVESGYNESTNITLVTEVAGMAVDGAGNIFFSGYNDGNVYEALAAGGYATTVVVSGAFTRPFGLAVDGSGNLFVADRNNAVMEIPFSGGIYGPPVAIGSGFSDPFGLALDASGNVYVADQGNNALKEILQAGGYTSVTTLANVTGIRSVAVDANYNVYLAIQGSANAVSEILAVDGVIPDDPTINTLITDSNGPEIVTLDPFGDPFYGTAAGSTIIGLDYFAPQPLSFATTTVGSTSSDSPKTSTVVNLGNQPMSFLVPGSGTNASISANFTLGNSTTCPVISPSGSQGTLAANTSCVYTVNFVPTAVGSLTGSLTMTDNALNGSDGTQSIQLSGTATAPLAPSVSLAPTTLAFGNQAVGAASASQAVLLTNTGTATLSLTAITVTGTNSADFGQTNNCGATLAASASCTVNVTFTPSVAGAESATLQFTDNASDSPQTAPLSGTGVASVTPSYSISANPSTLTIVQGQSGTTTLTVTPVGGMTGTLAFSCTGLPANANCVFSPTQVVMTGNNAAASVSLTVNTTGANGAIAQSQTNQGQPTEILPSHAGETSAGSMALFILPAGLVLFMIPGRASTKRRAYMQFALLLLIGLSSMAGMTACGDRSPSKATPVGQYSVSAVAAVGGSNGQSAVVTITITQ